MGSKLTRPSRIIEFVFVLLLIAVLVATQESVEEPVVSVQAEGALSYFPLIRPMTLSERYQFNPPVKIVADCPELQGRDLAIEKVGLGMTLQEITKIRGPHRSQHKTDDFYVFGEQLDCWTYWDETRVQLNASGKASKIEGYTLFVDGQPFAENYQNGPESRFFLDKLPEFAKSYQGLVELSFPSLELVVESKEGSIMRFRLESPSDFSQ